ncbi:WAS/WASL-interacting protein family member 1-like [Phyllostomus discolor]|uniref:WAS/WASL-interacting protein family member 1-like n=1 Tax=Phyllostomus discolor TaxID=89673 RepID=A0A7E6CH65_9CHIR|nr:WAS/WASL-interacting protein family member 1-like [Phyllostomus discolor]
MKLLFNLASHGIPTQAATRLDLKDTVRSGVRPSPKDKRTLANVRSAARAESRRRNSGEELPGAGGRGGRGGHGELGAAAAVTQRCACTLTHGGHTVTSPPNSQEPEGGRDLPVATHAGQRSALPDAEPRPGTGQTPRNGLRSVGPGYGLRQSGIFDSQLPSPCRLRIQDQGLRPNTKALEMAASSRFSLEASGSLRLLPNPLIRPKSAHLPPSPGAESPGLFGPAHMAAAPGFLQHLPSSPCPSPLSCPRGLSTQARTAEAGVGPPPRSRRMSQPAPGGHEGAGRVPLAQGGAVTPTRRTEAHVPVPPPPRDPAHKSGPCAPPDRSTAGQRTCGQASDRTPGPPRQQEDPGRQDRAFLPAWKDVVEKAVHSGCTDTGKTWRPPSQPSAGARRG